MKQPAEQYTNDSARRTELRGRPYWGLAVFVIILIGVIIVFLVARPGPPPPPPGPPHTRSKTKSASGVLAGFKYNPHLDYNAIVVRVGQAGTLTIDFRPHTARQVMDLAAANDSVEVSYMTHPNDEVVGYVLVSLKNARTGKEIILDELPPPPDIPPNHSAEYFTIQHPDLITDQYGGIVAIRNGKLLFHFKPGLVDDILPLIRSAKAVGVSAVWRDDHAGFVNVNGDKVYVVLSVTIDNKTFLVR